MEHPSGKKNEKMVKGGFYEWTIKHKTTSLMKKNDPKIQELLNVGEEIIGYVGGYTQRASFSNRAGEYEWHLLCFTNSRIFIIPDYSMLKEIWKGNIIHTISYENIETSIRKAFFIKQRPCMKIQTDEFPNFTVDLGWNDYEIITELVKEKCKK